jgi:peptidoglycan/LPS O-acetylase OafA/YrhL
MSMSPATDASRRLAALDGLRGIAALGIVLIHVWMYDHGDAGKPAKSLFDIAVGELRLGVPLFFLLSGFLLFRPFAAAAAAGRPSPSIRNYALRRAARILPAYWMALAVAFVALGLAGHSRAAGAGDLPVFLLFLQNYGEATRWQLDPPMWTLCVEVSFYLVLPLLGLLALRQRGTTRIAALCGGLLVAGVTSRTLAMLGDWPPTTTDSLLTHGHEFAAGMLVATLVHGRQLSVRAGRAMFASGAALVLANASWHGFAIGAYGVRELIGDLPAVAGFALMVGAIAVAPLRAPVLTSRPAQLAGTLSYGLYLLHYIAIDTLRATGLWPEQLGLSLALVYAFGLGGAMLSWRYLEAPAMRWARRRTAREHPARARTSTRPARRPQPEPVRS